MRGKVKEWDTESQVLGITPAYAGKRRSGQVHQFLHWDHPRLCGEKGIGVGMLDNTKGSPPPMRGKEYML